MRNMLKQRRNRKRCLLWIGLFLLLFSVIFSRTGFTEDDSDSVRKIYHLKIDGIYLPPLANYIKRGVKEAEENDAAMIIVELDTPGGLIASEFEIAKALLGTDIPTLAWVNKEAASAGGATVVACNNIVVSRGATFGAVVPVIPIPGREPKELGPKYISYMREHVASHAEANGIFPKLGAAMTDKRIELSYLEYWRWAGDNKDKFIEKGFGEDIGEYIDAKIKKYEQMQREHDPKFKAKDEDPERGESNPPESEDNDENPQNNPGTEAGIQGPPAPAPVISASFWDVPNEEEPRNDADYGISSRRSDWRDELSQKWFITEKGLPLTLRAEQAIDLKIALGQANSIRGIKEILGRIDKYKHLRNADVVSLGQNWSEELARILLPISFLFLIGGIIGIATELKIPGFGVPGILGILCFGLFFFAHFGYTMADWIHIALFLVGLTLLAVELFVIPGFGITGISGIILMLIGIFLTILKKPIPDLPDMPVPMPIEAIGYALMRLVLSLMGSIVVLFLLFRYVLPHTPFMGRIVLVEVQDTAKGFHASEGTPLESPSELIGKVGTSISMLRPAGKAIFDGKRYDVVTQGDLIDKGDEIKIIEVKGNHIVVKKV